MRDVCRGCRSCRGHHTDVQCCGKTVHQTRVFSHTFSVTRSSHYSSWRMWACFGVKCSATAAVEIWRGPHNLIFLKDLGDDVGGRLLGPSVPSPGPSSMALGSSRVSHFPRNSIHHVRHRHPLLQVRTCNCCLLCHFHHVTLPPASIMEIRLSLMTVLPPAILGPRL